MLAHVFNSRLAGATGSGTDFVRVDTTTGGAWVEIVGVDLAKYAGNDLGQTPCQLELKSANGSLLAFLAAQATGEALDSNKITNSTFEGGTSGWSSEASAVLAAIAGGNPSGNCLEIKAIHNDQEAAVSYLSSAFPSGVIWKASIDYKKGTNSNFIIYFRNASLGSINVSGTTSWNTTTKYGYDSTGEAWGITIYNNNNLADSTVLADNVIIARVTEPNAIGGFHLMSTLNGTSRGVVTLGTFNPYAVTEWRILGRRRVVGRGIW